MATVTSAAALTVQSFLPSLSSLQLLASSCHKSPATGNIRGRYFCAAVLTQARQLHVQINAFSPPPPTPKGFGVPPKKKQQQRPFTRTLESEESKDKKEQEDEDDVVPEVISNRMLKRIGFTVGIPVMVGVLSYPLYYYIKVVGNLDVPPWIPFTTSLILFGTAGLGITYGILSTSWDPLREGSLLGWEEAKTNWPVFWKQATQKKED